MSRFKDWHNTLNKIIWRLEEQENISFDKAEILAKKKINEFYPDKKDNSSFTDRILYARKNYSKFCNFLNNK